MDKHSRWDGKKNRIFNLHIEHWKVVTAFLMMYDILAVVMSYFLALWLRFDCRFQKIPKEYLLPYYQSILFYAGFCIVVFWILRLYKCIWRLVPFDTEVFIGQLSGLMDAAYKNKENIREMVQEVVSTYHPV